LAGRSTSLVTVSDTDQYGRLLQYVATTSTSDVGLSLISSG